MTGPYCYDRRAVEIAYRMGCIDAEQVRRLGEPLAKSNYGRYLLQLLEQRVF